jgi:hypothetical protein
VGGVVLTPLYYEHALACEGRASSGLPSDAKLLFTKAAPGGGGGGGITLVPANEARRKGFSFVVCVLCGKRRRGACALR